MFAAYIDGWDAVLGIGNTEEEAENAALLKKKTFPEECPSSWNEAVEYYGAWVEEINPGEAVRV